MMSKIFRFSHLNGFYPTTVRAKIILLCCSIAFLVSLIIGALNFYRISNIMLETAVEGLAGETRLMSMKFKSAFTSMKNDAVLVSHTPPIEGIIRSASNDGVDPLDGSTMAQLRARLETFFISIMSSRPDYTQIRFIGASQNGLELVRVNQTLKGPMRVSPKNMQQKGQEGYFVEARGYSQGRVYFSEVTYNRENGKVASKLVSTVRAALPVFDISGKFFGIIVINSDYEKLLSRTFDEIFPDKNTFIINHAGDYIEFTSDRTLSRLELHSHYTAVPPEFLEKLIKLDRNETSIFEADWVEYFVRLNIDSFNPRSFIGVVLRVPKDELLREAYSTRRENIALGCLLLGLSLLFAVWVSARLTDPLKKMTKTISLSDGGSSKLDLPVKRDDEFGALARSFSKMTTDLRESEAQVTAVIESVLDGLIKTDDQGVIESYNPASELIFGYKAEEAVGRNIAFLMTAPFKAKFQSFLVQQQMSGDGELIDSVHEIQGLRADGTTFPLEISVSEIEFQGSRHYISMMRDITERKAAELEREKLIKQLSRSNEELDSFAHIASHDLKEPLRAIHNHSSFLIEDHEKDLDEDGVKRLHRMQSLTKRMEKLISDLLYFSRLGRETMSIKETDLNEVIADIEDMLEDTLKENNAKIIVPKPLPVIVCDTVRITEMFRNLITNAIKYNDHDEKFIEIGVMENDANTFGASTFYVKDNGIGIAEEFQADVFKLFKRLNSQKLYGGGTGSGLTFVKKIIEQHGGRIWISSEAGKGTTFYFTISNIEEMAA